MTAEAYRVHGPSAAGGDPRRFWNLARTLAATDWKVRFYGSALGYVWSLLRPLMLFGIVYFVFSEIVGAGAGIDHYGVILLLAMILYFFFSEVTGAGVTAMVDRESLLRKVGFPRAVVPLSVALVAAMNLALNLVVLAIFVVANGVEPRWTLAAAADPVRAHARLRDRRRDAAQRAVRALPRRAPDLGRRAAGALLRDADPLSDRGGHPPVRDAREDRAAQPARDAHAGGAPPARRRAVARLGARLGRAAARSAGDPRGGDVAGRARCSSASRRWRRRSCRRAAVRAGRCPSNQAAWR